MADEPMEEPAETPGPAETAQQAPAAAPELDDEPIAELRVLRRGRRRRRALVVLLVLAIGLGVLAVPAGGVLSEWWMEAVALADRHVQHRVAHKGWSFPARIMSGEVAADAAIEQQLRAARVRGYVEDCGPAPKPGSYCASKTKRVVPRSGRTLEPVLLEWLIGPDAELREHLPLSEAPRHLTDAIITAEDKDFRTHPGVNLVAMLRAAFADVQDRSYAQGGSTLSMQLVREMNQRHEKTLVRKLKEAVMALAIDRHLGKDGVLSMYLDAPYLGQKGSLSVSGFEAAAHHYFGKSARALSLAEAATLAAILPAPAKFAPDRAPAVAKERRDRVLRAMAERLNYDVRAALAEPMVTVPPEPLPERAPAYVSVVREWLETRLPADVLYGSGLVVTAGIDLAMQADTDELFPARTRLFEGMLKKPAGGAPLEAAGVLIDLEGGRIRAVYAGSNPTATGFNRATQARRQGGSALKPLVYAMAMSAQVGGHRRYTAASVEPNLPRVFKTPAGDWRPHNVGGEYSETVSLAQGLAWSQNLATASLLEELGGPRPFIDFAERVGFDVRRFPEEMGLALGTAEVTPLEMAELAGMVAAGGKRVEATPVSSIVDVRGVDRLPAAARTQHARAGSGSSTAQVIDAESAALTRELMRLVIEVGTGGAARGTSGEVGYPGPAIGKTGTTDAEKDLWFVGATPRYAAAVWLGYDRPATIGASASDLAAPLWGWWLARATKGDGPAPSFPDEPKIVRRWICTVSGKLAGPTCQTIPAPFLPGTEPRSACPIEHPPPEAADQPWRESIWKRIAREEQNPEVPPGPPKTPVEEASARGRIEFREPR
jgi:membrane peptidoglycan carboxypeptidase